MSNNLICEDCVWNPKQESWRPELEDQFLCFDCQAKTEHWADTLCAKCSCINKRCRVCRVSLSKKSRNQTKKFL